MAIRIMKNDEQLINSIDQFDKSIKNLVLIEITNKTRSFTLEYHDGSLSRILDKSGRINNNDDFIQDEVPRTINCNGIVLVYGFVTLNMGMEGIVITDFSLESNRISHYTDRLSVLKSWGFPVTEYQSIDRRNILGAINNQKVIRNQLMIIPDKQDNHSFNNWPIVVK